MDEILLAVEFFDKHDELARVIGGVVKKQISIIFEVDEDSKGYGPATPFLEISAYDPKSSESFGEVMLEPLVQIPLNNDQVEKLKKYYEYED